MARSSRTWSGSAASSGAGATRCSTRSSTSSPAGRRWSRPDGGYFVWVELPVETATLLERAEPAGVTFVKGADFFPAAGGGEQRPPALAFSYESPSSIAEGVSLLASLV